MADENTHIYSALFKLICKLATPALDLYLTSHLFITKFEVICHNFRLKRVKMTQKYPTDWDIDQYRDETEPEDHWALKKEFMKVHKGKFSEEYLVALAKTFANIEFLGCIYPAALMIRIAELSKEVAKDYREEKKTKLQRTFVSASNAAENKVKRK